jgi:hypothetical protein
MHLREGNKREENKALERRKGRGIWESNEGEEGRGLRRGRGIRESKRGGNKGG